MNKQHVTGSDRLPPGPPQRALQIPAALCLLQMTPSPALGPDVH